MYIYYVANSVTEQDEPNPARWLATESPNENENKENKNVDEFHEFILQLTSVKTQNDMKAWRWYYFQGNKNRELCDIPGGELNSLLCKCL